MIFLLFQIFTQRRVSPSLKMVVNKALAKSCEAGNLEEVRRALETGADPNSCDGDWTCLMIAAEKDHAEVVSLLLEQPTIEVNTVGWRNQTALHLACMNNSEAALRRLLSVSGLDMNGWTWDGDGPFFTPIMFAVSHGHVECVRLLSAVAEVDLDCKFPDRMNNHSLEER